MSAQGNNQLASERREIMKCIKLNVKQKLSKSKAEINPGSKLRVLAITLLFALKREKK